MENIYLREVPTQDDYDTAIENGLLKSDVDRRVKDGMKIKQAITKPIKFVKNKEMRDMKILAQKNGISEKTFNKRLKQGYKPLDAAIKKACKYRHLKEIRERNGINELTFYSRIKRGMDPKEAASKPLDNRGRKCKFTEIAKENGISISTFRNRVSRGWDKQRAATEPVKNVGLHVKKQIS